MSWWETLLTTGSVTTIVTAGSLLLQQRASHRHQSELSAAEREGHHALEQQRQEHERALAAERSKEVLAERWRSDRLDAHVSLMAVMDEIFNDHLLHPVFERILDEDEEPDKIIEAADDFPVPDALGQSIDNVAARATLLASDPARRAASDAKEALDQLSYHLAMGRCTVRVLSAAYGEYKKTRVLYNEAARTELGTT